MHSLNVVLVSGLA